MTRRWTILTLLVGIAIVGIAGYAIGAGNSSKNLVLCASKKSGDLSVASAKGKCAKGEKKLTVAKEGPVGPAGATGPAGPAGSAANVTPEAIHYVTGPANDECFAKPGTFCEASLGDIVWGNSTAGYGPVGYYKDAAGAVRLTGVAKYTTGGISGSFEPEGPFYLPPGYRPNVVKVFTAAAQQGSEFTHAVGVLIRPNGVVAVQSDEEYYEVSLDEISFRVP
jgi:hypothetical protein